MEWAHFLFLQLVSMMSVSLFHCVDAQAGTTANPSFGYTLRENLKATMSVMLVAFFSAFVFMGIFSFYIRHCSHRYGPRRSPLVVATDMCRRSCANPQVIIDKCPVLVYSAVKDLKIGKGTLECAVCLSEFQDCDNIRLLPKCHHLFHQDCVDEWLLPHMSCPLCRAALTSDIALTAETEQQHLQNHVVEAAVVRDDLRGGQSGESDVTKTLPPRESRMLERLARSHSTGHSLVELPKESLVVVDRYTLRLPDHVRNQILASRSMVRRFATSDVVLPGAWSSKRVCYRGGGGGGGGGGGEGCNGAPFVSGGKGLGSSTANTDENSGLCRFGGGGGGGEVINGRRCWTPVRMSFSRVEGAHRPAHLLPPV